MNNYNGGNFNEEFYNLIQAFQGEKVINTLGHVKDIYAIGDAIYMPPITRLNTSNFIVLQASLMQELWEMAMCLKSMKIICKCKCTRESTNFHNLVDLS